MPMKSPPWLVTDKKQPEHIALGAFRVADRKFEQCEYSSSRRPSENIDVISFGLGKHPVNKLRPSHPIRLFIGDTHAQNGEGAQTPPADPAATRCKLTLLRAVKIYSVHKNTCSAIAVSAVVFN